MTKYIDKYYLNGELYGIKFGGGGRQPGANTIAYYPFNGDINDYKGSYDLSVASGTVSYETIVGSKKCVSFSRDNGTVRLTSSLSTSPKTVSFWMKWCDLAATPQDWRQLLGCTSDFEDNGWSLRCKPTTYNSISIDGSWLIRTSDGQKTYINTSMVDLNWNYFTLTCDNSNTYLYFNGTLMTSVVGYFDAGGYNFSMGLNLPSNCYFGDFIMESVQRTAQEISDYYNQTKSLYGIS